MVRKPLILGLVAAAALGAFIGFMGFEKSTGYAIGFAGLFLILFALAIYEKLGHPLLDRRPR